MVPRLRRTPPPSVPVEPAHSKTAHLARIIHDGSSRNCAVATRDRRPEPRGGATPRLGVLKRVRSFRGILQGGWPPCRSGRGRLQSQAYDGREAYLKQYVDRPNGEPACLDTGPTASRCVATALARSSALCMIVARRKNTAVDSAFRLRDCSRNVHE